MCSIRASYGRYFRTTDVFHVPVYLHWDKRLGRDGGARILSGYFASSMSVVDVLITLRLLPHSSQFITDRF
jgi:hypothetical protein